MALRQFQNAPEELFGCRAAGECAEKRLERRLDAPVLGREVGKQRRQTLSLRLSQEYYKHKGLRPIPH